MDIQHVKIFVLEDDDADFMLIERAFRKERLVNEIVRAKDGVEALEILRGTTGRKRLLRPYVVLSDINMPRMDGLSFVAEIRNDPELKNTLVFMLTTSEYDKDIRTAYGLNVAGYMLKGQAGKEFLKIVHMLEGYIQVLFHP
jgi:CheY-like chemotaxis protein